MLGGLILKEVKLCLPITTQKFLVRHCSRVCGACAWRWEMEDKSAGHVVLWLPQYFVKCEFSLSLACFGTGL